jgi:hypothetical protein
MSILARIVNLSAVVVLLVEFFGNMVLGFRVSQKPFKKTFKEKKKKINLRGCMLSRYL